MPFPRETKKMRVFVLAMVAALAFATVVDARSHNKRQGAAGGRHHHSAAGGGSHRGHHGKRH
jgi:hypothetical protein